MARQLSKLELRKRATKLRHKAIAKEKREIKRNKKQAYKQWADAIKGRDDYTCQVCKTCYKGKDPRSIQAAHLLSKENYPSVMLHMLNGITLCFACHKNAKISSHLDGVAFTFWLEKNKPEQYFFVRKIFECY